MRKILLSLLTIGAVSALAVYTTRAFFSDTETSRNNILQAGEIDLIIDNESYYFGPGETIERQDNLSWTFEDHTIKKFFDFADLKPGDWGEDTISIHVNSNEAWACANITLTQSHENGRNDAERDAGDNTGGPWGGELDDELSFAFWVDDGDNVYEKDEGDLILSGKASDLPQGDDNQGRTFTLADSQTNIFDPASGAGLDPDEDYYIGKYWCYGDMTPNALDPNDSDDWSPIAAQDSGFDCSGQGVGNQSQSDRLRADISFYAEQKRHNSAFQCSAWNPNVRQTPSPTTEPSATPTPTDTISVTPTGA